MSECTEGRGRCSDPNRLTPDARRLHDAVHAEAARLGIEIRTTETVRWEQVQDAYYAQGRMPTGSVNNIRAHAGLEPITAEQNKRPVTWTMKSRHLPNKAGLSCAFDIAIRNKETGGWFDPKVDADHNGIPDWKQFADFALSLGIRGAKAGYYFRDDLGHPRTDACHFEVSNG